jgi:glyoxylase-like metal-dependent hydrolase (beta-lactamase superfamily II)
VLIDTADGQHSEYYDNLHKALRDEGVKLSVIILTHWHHDHVGGILGVVEKLGLGVRIEPSSRETTTLLKVISRLPFLSTNTLAPTLPTPILEAT